MASRLKMLARIGLLAAAASVFGIPAAFAQGDGRFGRQGATITPCPIGNCLPGGGRGTVIRRPSAEAPVLRRRGGPPPFRQYEYRGNRHKYHGGGHYYRPRYYRPYYYRPYYYDHSPSVYLDFSLPYYDDYYEPPYARRAYRRVQMSAEHVEWCYDRYRSYRESDNTYQPYNGPRRQCYSPYS